MSPEGQAYRLEAANTICEALLRGGHVGAVVGP